MGSNMLHSFKFETEGIGTRIVMDGEQLRGVYKADISFTVNKLPMVTLQFLTNDIEVDVEDAQATEKLGGLV